MDAKQIADELEDFILEFTNEIAEEVYSGARRRTPVRTGRAQRGWEIVYSNKVGESATVYNDVPYVPYLEFGTSRMEPFHMVTATLIEIGNRY